MTCSELLLQVERKGGRLALGPKGELICRAIPKNLSAAVRSNSYALKALLRQRVPTPTVDDAPPLPEPPEYYEQLNAAYDERYPGDAHDLPRGECSSCGGNVYWRRPTGGRVCQQCHPNPHQPAQLPKSDEDVRALLPPGVRLVAFERKPAPLAISRLSIVGNVPLFISTTLEQLRAALDGRPWLAGNWSVRELVEVLEQAGVKLEVEP